MRFRLGPTVPPAESAVPAGTLLEERPPVGLARGKYAAAPWLIGTLGALLVLTTVGYFLLRFWRTRAP